MIIFIEELLENGLDYCSKMFSNNNYYCQGQINVQSPDFTKEN